MKPGNNDPCPCGSGKKYKKCCLDKLTARSTHQTPQTQAQTAPGQQEIGALLSLFNQQRYIEVERMARSVTERFPHDGFGWKVLGTVLKQMRQSANALEPMQKAAALLPGDAEIQNNLGAILKDLGQLDEAAASYRRALKIKPDLIGALTNLGLTLQYLGQPQEAVTSYRRALEIKPDFVEAHYSLGNALKELGQLDEAEMSYRRALEIKPDFAGAHNNLGVALKELGRLEEAVACYKQALHIQPDFADGYGNLGGVLRVQGKLDEALACFQQQVKLAPENEAAQHQIASLSGTHTERAPAQYVEGLFDGCADKFDTHLQQALKYDAPNKLVALLTQHSMPPTGKWDVLDLGCGTGLVGAAISPFARQLVGVDLSSKMLEKARARKLYHRLERLDLLTMMLREQTASYHLVIAADVLIYLGKLDELIREINRLLRPGGMFAFSVEALETRPDAAHCQNIQPEYRLESTGRYTHSPDYIARLAATNGLMTQEMTPVQIRIEYGKPVQGYLVLWKK